MTACRCTPAEHEAIRANPSLAHRFVGIQDDGQVLELYNCKRSNGSEGTIAVFGIGPSKYPEDYK